MINLEQPPHFRHRPPCPHLDPVYNLLEESDQDFDPGWDFGDGDVDGSCGYGEKRVVEIGDRFEGGSLGLGGNILGY
jgi:hypothetical protein